jgi:glycosyltransferase involved in cell wall biosynthesis
LSTDRDIGGRLVYVRPSFGGIFDYSDSVLRIMRARFPALETEVVTTSSGGNPLEEGLRLARDLRRRPGVIYADLGLGDAAMFWALLRLVRERAVVVTLHDPGMVVNGIIRSQRLEAGPPLLARAVRSGTFRLERLIGRRVVGAMLRRCRAVLVLNPAVPSVLGVPLQYLPQPVYDPVVHPHAMPRPAKLAYLGYWGPSKGIEDLLEAYRALLPRFPEARFVMAGGGVPGDPFEASFRARVAAVSPRISMPGFIPPDELTTFLRSLSALILPYHPELAGGASAMLMRAQEAGVPLVVSDTPMLRAQVGASNVTIVPPRDHRALGDALAALITDPQAHNDRAAREQARIHAEHGHPAVAARLAEILARAVA